jgi:hypothetical protein
MEEVLSYLDVKYVSVEILLANGLAVQVVHIDGGHLDAPAVVSRPSKCVDARRREELTPRLTPVKGAVTGSSEAWRASD